MARSVPVVNLRSIYVKAGDELVLLDFVHSAITGRIYICTFAFGDLGHRIFLQSVRNDCISGMCGQNRCFRFFG